jgi:hypothetical protein
MKEYNFITYKISAYNLNLSDTIYTDQEMFFDDLLTFYTFMEYLLNSQLNIKVYAYYHRKDNINLTSNKLFIINYNSLTNKCNLLEYV